VLQRFGGLSLCFAVPVLLFSVGLPLASIAADKSGVSANSISLPKGPGSIEGLGDSFQPTLNTGTAKYGLGLKLPPGTAGHQPSLALSYEGGGGNGPLGYGGRSICHTFKDRLTKAFPRTANHLRTTAGHVRQ
jgi:hypothetical protein